MYQEQENSPTRIWRKPQFSVLPIHLMFAYLISSLLFLSINQIYLFPDTHLDLVLYRLVLFDLIDSSGLLYLRDQQRCSRGARERPPNTFPPCGRGQGSGEFPSSTSHGSLIVFYFPIALLGTCKLAFWLAYHANHILFLMSRLWTISNRQMLAL